MKHATSVGTILLATVACLALACASRSKAAPAEVAHADLAGLPVGATPGSRAPAIQLVNAAGDPVDLDGLKGEVVLLNFWAPWCGPCVKEMPSLQKLHEELKPSGLNVIGAALDTTPKAAQIFSSEMGITFDLWIDSSADAARSFRVRAIPMTFLIDRRGVVRTRYSGAREWYDPATIAEVRELLEESG